MASNIKGKALLLIQLILYLHHLIQSSIPQNLGVASKVTTLVTESMFYLRIVYSICKRYLESPENFHCGRTGSIAQTNNR